MTSPTRARTFCAAQQQAAASDEANEKSPALQQDLPRDVFDPKRIRNVAIIAHVDHGKTTLVDRILKQCAVKMLNDRMMDSNVIEKERGITILAKVTGVEYTRQDASAPLLVNVVDTPGHADFGGEVERVLSMVDGAILLVDAAEGPMTQTKFVVSKALQYNLRPIVVINKVDKESVVEGTAESAVFDLFASLEATDEQLEFPILYASARDGWVSPDFSDRTRWQEKNLDVTPLMEAIASHVQCPNVDVNAPFSFLVTMISRDPFLGKMVTGKVHSGTAFVGDQVKVLTRDGEAAGTGRIMKVRASRGLRSTELDRAIAGDVVTILGVEAASVGDTICHGSVTAPLFAPQIDPPTVSINFCVNDSPIKGKDGTVVTSQKLGERLFAEAESNVSISVGYSKNREQLEVQGRGELQLGILIENMRREGMELAISPPKVLYKNDEKGKLLEPIEEVLIEVDEEHSGVVIDKLNRRHGHLSDVSSTAGGRSRIKMTIPARCLIGFRPIFMGDTRGSGILYSTFHGYELHRGDTSDPRKGVICSTATGTATAYALEPIQERGTLFITPGMDVYEGMIIGESKKDDDMVVNPVKEKQLTNVRTTLKEEHFRFSPAKPVLLEHAIGYIQAGELIEVTPKNVRLRKLILNYDKRKSFEKRKQPYE
ncbi:GTP-binding protein TypA/BipA-like [Porphyridium purpureum]|uniref:GTP-binding protein TypA/BipA-like n=1 Tax=Porphyridium purpureum TaxID=35688 RepID=A0A5J4YWJ0_PORPP|nr:GTP-binding protein TypA/BipA-like [Porphyridium purpureum]|eukprot:POR4732..scf209_3